MKKTLVALLLVLVVALPVALTACNKGIDRTQWLGDAVERTDYTSVYDKYGANISIADVTENADGSATITKDGKTYTLGLDFLSMAMVYNCQVPTGSTKYHTEEDVYNEWWKLYIQRWNKMVPEVPLYSNQYYDIYAAKIDQFKTSPYWSGAAAVVGATSTDNQIILGSSTDLSGLFRVPAFGKTSPGAADNDIADLITGYSTVVADFEGAIIWNEDVVTEIPEKETNSDGSITYTIEIKPGLKMSDGSEITADNYIVGTLVGNTPLYGAAGGSSSGSYQLKGYKSFLEYDGTNGDKASKWFEAIKKLDTYKFSVTIDAEYASYYYSTYYAAFAPEDVDIYLCGASIEVNEETKAVGLSNDFYATETKNGVTSFTNAAKIAENIKNNDASKFAFSGPYIVSSYDAANKIATLSKNTNYVTETYRKYVDDQGVAHDGNITTVKYVKISSETQTDQLKTGIVNVLQGITGGDDTKAALALTANGEFKETHYDRAGYGKLAFKGDYGPTQFVEVRQAIMHSINRDQFAQTFTGGFGKVVHGPYYEGSSAYLANKESIKLDTYAYNKDTAIKLLKEGGWIYNADGTAYDEAKGGVRYKKLEGIERSKANLQFVSYDNKYGTTRVEKDGVVSYYLPLVINWSGTQPNDVTDLLKTSWSSSSIVSQIGMYVAVREGEFEPVLYGDYYQMTDAGYNNGDHPNCSAANFATGFNSSIYDMSMSWTINQDYYADYNMQLMDPADFWADYQN